MYNWWVSPIIARLYPCAPAHATTCSPLVQVYCPLVYRIVLSKHPWALGVRGPKKGGGRLQREAICACACIYIYLYTRIMGSAENEEMGIYMGHTILTLLQVVLHVHVPACASNKFE